MKKNMNEKIIDFLEEHGPSTSSVIAKNLSLSQASTTSRLVSMRKQKKYAVLNCDREKYPFVYSVDKGIFPLIERVNKFGQRI